jgi:hypothetical protein
MGKNTYFNQYKNYIVKIELKVQKDGSKSVFVAHIAPSEVKR